jgi:hypothetical protein
MWPVQEADWIAREELRSGKGADNTDPVDHCTIGETATFHYSAVTLTT